MNIVDNCIIKYTYYPEHPAPVSKEPRVHVFKNESVIYVMPGYQHCVTVFSSNSCCNTCVIRGSILFMEITQVQ